MESVEKEANQSTLPAADGAPEATRFQQISSHPASHTSQPASHTSQQESNLRDNEDSDDGEQVRFDPPPPVTKRRRGLVKSFGFTLGFVKYAVKMEDDKPFCTRSARHKTTTASVEIQPDMFPGTFGATMSLSNAGFEGRQQVAQSANTPYIVVGIIGKEASVPTETLRLVQVREDLFKQIRKAEKHLRNPVRRILSLKRVAAFSLYRCHPSQDYHSMPSISDETVRCLAELYRNYRTEKRDYNDRWLMWIHMNFNSRSHNPEEGVYALQLLLQWSPVKIIVWSFLPILLSLAIGLWYMIDPYPGEDHVAVVQTAWTIASYIVTTAALALASLAAVTQFGSI